MGQTLSIRAQTAKPRPLPPEILDLIVDHLHDERTTLHACCLVSKSWIPRTQKHLFAYIQFDPTDRPMIQSWKRTFPDPSDSPAHYVSTLSLQGIHASTLTDPGAGSWIRSFNCVGTLRTTLKLSALGQVSLVQLHGFSPTLKSLCLSLTDIPLSEVFNLVCSFPLLEDLELFTFGSASDIDDWVPPSTSPKLTGFLLIGLGIPSVARRLCDLPGGLHFSKVRLWCESEDDVASTMDLVSRCSATLESFAIHCHIANTPGAPSLDFSKATKLKHVELNYSRSIQWITMAIKTIESKNLQQITVFSYGGTISFQIKEAVPQEWQDLDHLLVQFWTSHSIRPKIMYRRNQGGEDEARGFVQRLLPELTRRGVVDVVERDR